MGIAFKARPTSTSCQKRKRAEKRLPRPSPELSLAPSDTGRRGEAENHNQNVQGGAGSAPGAFFRFQCLAKTEKGWETASGAIPGALVGRIRHSFSRRSRKSQRERPGRRPEKSNFRPISNVSNVFQILKSPAQCRAGRTH